MALLIDTPLSTIEKFTADWFKGVQPLFTSKLAYENREIISLWSKEV